MDTRYVEVRCNACQEARPSVKATLVAVCAVQGSSVVVSGVRRESRSAAVARGTHRDRRSILVPALVSDGERWRVRCHRCGAAHVIARRDAVAAAALLWREVWSDPSGDEIEDSGGGAGGGAAVVEVPAEHTAQTV